MTFLLALVPGFLLLTLFTGGGLAGEETDLDGDGAEDKDGGPGDVLATDATTAQGEGEGPTGDDSVWGQADGDDMLPAESPDQLARPWDDQAFMAPLNAELSDFDLLYQDDSTDPVVIDDFDAGSDMLELVLGDDVADGELGVESLDDGQDSAITMNGVQLVVLQGVQAADVSLDQISITRQS